VEVAVLDALTRHAGLDLLHFFGGAREALETDMTITTGTLEEASVAARSIHTAGFKTIKLKVGGRPLAEDLQRLRAVCEAAPSAQLIVDANASMSAGEAVALVRSACDEEIPLALFEQPCAAEDLQGLAAVRAVGGCPVAADESATNARSVLRLASLGAVDVVNIKLMKCGVVEALDMVAVARATGLGLMIGGNVETRLAMGASACFAAGLGCFDFVDLDTPLFLAEDPFEGGYVQSGPQLDLRPSRRGHGVVPRG
jgi:L-alanine-DL-glutamate epimerase-like enolase superfamily enzyme